MSPSGPLAASSTNQVPSRTSPSSLRAVSVASLVFPSVFQATAPDANIEGLSAFVAVLLIGAYAAYLLYNIFGFRGGSRRAIQYRVRRPRPR